MVPDDGPSDSIPSKRALQVEETFVSKKAKMNPELLENAMTSSNMCDHLSEIEALNQRLKQNDLETELLRQQLKQNELEIESLREQLKQGNLEIESLRQQSKENLEVVSLRKELKQKDYEISVLNKMIASVQKKRGLRS